MEKINSTIILDSLKGNDKIIYNKIQIFLYNNLNIIKTLLYLIIIITLVYLITKNILIPIIKKNKNDQK